MAPTSLFIKHSPEFALNYAKLDRAWKRWRLLGEPKRGPAERKINRYFERVDRALDVMDRKPVKWETSPRGLVRLDPLGEPQVVAVGDTPNF